MLMPDPISKKSWMAAFAAMTTWRRQRVKLSASWRYLLAGMTLAALPAHASSLRILTTLHGPNVYLRDLFDDAGPNAGRLLGPGPGPGGRIIVESAQLNAIARQYGVTWHSVSRADRAVLEWPGRPLREEEVAAAIRTAIGMKGVPDNVAVDIPDYTPVIVPAEATPAPVVSQLDYSPDSGRFTAELDVAGGGMVPIETRVTGEVVTMIDAPVAAVRLAQEAVVRPQDVRMARIRASIASNDIARTADQVIGMAVTRPIALGQPLALADLVRPPLVRRGATVRIELEANGLAVSGEAIAMDSGAQGETVRVQNTTSKAYLFARVVGPDRVRVTPDAPPALPSMPARYASDQ